MSGRTKALVVCNLVTLVSSAIIKIIEDWTFRGFITRFCMLPALVFSIWWFGAKRWHEPAQQN